MLLIYSYYADSLIINQITVVVVSDAFVLAKAKLDPFGAVVVVTAPTLVIAPFLEYIILAPVVAQEVVTVTGVVPLGVVPPRQAVDAVFSCTEMVEPDLFNIISPHSSRLG